MQFENETFFFYHNIRYRIDSRNMNYFHRIIFNPFPLSCSQWTKFNIEYGLSSTAINIIIVRQFASNMHHSSSSFLLFRDDDTTISPWVGYACESVRFCCVLCSKLGLSFLRSIRCNCSILFSSLILFFVANQSRSFGM